MDVLLDSYLVVVMMFLWLVYDSFFFSFIFIFFLRVDLWLWRGVVGFVRLLTISVTAGPTYPSPYWNLN